jgi:hypothetical protein
LTVSAAPPQATIRTEPDPGASDQQDGDGPRCWLIEPAAAPEDPWWQDRPIWQLAVVAPTPAMARTEAESWARRNGLHDQPHIGNESRSDNAGFGDVRLYHVRPLPEAEAVSPQWLVDDSVVVLAGPLKPDGTA